MGHVTHHAIIVTSWQEDAVAAAHSEAMRLELPATSIVEAAINGYWTFLVGPDGSKSGWPDDELGDERRKRFKDWLRLQIASRRWLDWVEVAYGTDDGAARIEDSPWSPSRDTSRPRA